MKKYKKYLEYKKTHLGWLNQIPSHWEVKRLKYLGDALIGLTYSPDDIVDEGEGTLVLRSSNVQNRQLAFHDNVYVRKVIPEKLITQNGDILICARNGSRALIGKNAKIDNSAVGLSFGAFMSIFRSPYNDYLSLVFNSPLFEYQSGSFLTATINQLTTGNLNSFEIPLPTKPEQNQIAKFLDHETGKIDRLIEKQQELIALLKEKRQAVISHAVTKGLNPNTPLKPSGIEWLGDVPEHWEVASISSVSKKITNGYVGPTRDIFQDDGIRYLQSLHIKRNQIDFHTPYYVSKSWSQSKQKSILKYADVLVVQTGDIGQVAAVTESFVGCNCHALIIIQTTSKIEGFYLSWVLNSDYGNKSLKSIQTGALHPHLNCGEVKTVKVPIPPTDEQQTIVEYLNSTKTQHADLVEKSEGQITLLQERRTALISAAVTGKIDVRDWEPPTANDK